MLSHHMFMSAEGVFGVFWETCNL